MQGFLILLCTLGKMFFLGPLSANNNGTLWALWMDVFAGMFYNVLGKEQSQKWLFGLHYLKIIFVFSTKIRECNWNVTEVHCIQLLPSDSKRD